MKLFSLFRKDLRILARNRPEMAVLFLMPLAFILPISFALGAGDGYGINRNNRMVVLPVINYDGGPRAQDLMATVGESLLLENNYDDAGLRALGLAGEEACEPGFGTDTGGPTGLAPTAEQPPTTAAAPTQDASGYPAAPPVETSPEAPAAATQAGGYPPAPTQETNAGVGEPTAASLAETPAAPAGEVSGQSSAACNEMAARALLDRSARTAALIIPAGFSQSVDSGMPAQVTLIYSPTGDTVQLQQIEGVVRGATTKISIENQVSRGFNQLDDLIVLAPESVRQSWQQQGVQPQAEEKDPALKLKKVSPASYLVANTPDTYQQTVPGYTVMFVFFLIAAMAGSIREEKRNGTFRRLLSAPVSRAELGAGKLLSAMIIGFVQVIFLFFLGAVIFRLSLGRDPLGFLILTGALVTTAAALGLAVSTTSLRGAGLAALLVVAALIGGCMFPVDLMPPLLRSLSYAVPHSWALSGYQSLMVRGLGLQEILPQVGALFGFALAFFLIAIWRFRFDD